MLEKDLKQVRKEVNKMRRRFRASPPRGFHIVESIPGCRGCHVAACGGCCSCSGCSCSCRAISCSADALATYWISRIEAIDLKKVKDEVLKAKIQALLRAKSP